LFIVASNEELDNALGDLVLDTSPITLANLVYHGIHIDESIYDINDDRQTFISNAYYQAEVQDALNIVPWLKEIGCDYVMFTGNRMMPELRKNLRDELTKINIVVADNSPSSWPSKPNKNDNETYNVPVVIRFRTSKAIDEPFRVAKTVQLVNSQPIDIK
jgi:hypothetical protein